MLLAVGGESRKIVLGEVPPACSEQDRDSAQDVAAQCVQGNIQPKNNISIKRNIVQKERNNPIPYPRLKTTNCSEQEVAKPANCKLIIIILYF